MSYVLEARKIDKVFPGVTALDAVDLGVRAGSVHAVVGENGAGKSTLMKVLAGVYLPDAGEILLDGSRVVFASPRAAERAGVVLIHQELSLVSALSVAENIFLGREPSRLGFVDRRAMEGRSEALLDRLGHRLDPRRPVASLKVSDQQIVEIAKALALDARVLIMDEPTTALAPEQVDRLFRIMRALAATDRAIVYISHKLDELFRIADEFTVLRDGRRIGHRRAAETTPPDLVRMMVGRDLALPRDGGDRKGAELLRVERLSSDERRPGGRPRLVDISFSLRAGEVLGVAGLLGAGRTELLECLFGVRKAAPPSTVSLNGKPVTLRSPRDAIDAGFALVPEDRKTQGLVLDFDVRRNITLARLTHFTRMGFVRGARESRAAQASVDRLGIKASHLHAAAIELSGGNQQKVVLAKWLLTAPKVLLLDEPTKGIDINGKTEIYGLIKELAARGIGILLVSSELPELLALSDRIVVLREGHLVAALDRSDATEERIIECATLSNDPTGAVA